MFNRDQPNTMFWTMKVSSCKVQVYMVSCQTAGNLQEAYILNIFKVVNNDFESYILSENS